MNAQSAVLRGPRKIFRRITETTTGKVGLLLLVIVVALAFLGGFVAPYSPYETVGIPGQAPGGAHVFGLDFIGRDVLSRILYGGRSTLVLAALSTLVTYVIGTAIGLFAGYKRTLIDAVLMRGVDILLSLPALLVILLLVTAFSSSPVVLVLATALVLLPGVARIVRSATMEVSTRSYVEAAVARGEGTWSILVHEVLPNIRGVIAADLGLRFSWSIILIASVNFLGIGIQPPTPDWGVMASENRVIVGSNPMGLVGPCLALALLVVAINLVSDTYTRQSDRRDESK